MAMSGRFRGSYSVENVGKFTVEASDLPTGATEEELREFYQEAADYDLRINGSAHAERGSEFIEWALEVIAEREERDR